VLKGRGTAKADICNRNTEISPHQQDLEKASDGIRSLVPVAV